MSKSHRSGATSLFGSAAAHAQVTGIGIGEAQCLALNAEVEPGADWSNTPTTQAMQAWAQGYVSGIDHALQVGHRPTVDLAGRNDELWRAMVTGCRAYPSALLQNVVEDYLLRVGGFKH